MLSVCDASIFELELVQFAESAVVMLLIILV